MNRILSIIVTIQLVISVSYSIQDYQWNIGADPDPEIHMDTTQLITSKGYPCEEFDVHTDDGYILGVQRIPAGRNEVKEVITNVPRPVVLLQHGLFSCSAVWVENLANESLGFLLADAGFDVWLANSRGNTYSKRHEKLNPKQIEFWDFSWDEMAQYDLPATVDKILNITKVPQLFLVGHSQGGTIGFAQLAQDPIFASKIKLFAPLAPAVYMNGIQSPIKLLSPFAYDLAALYKLFGKGQLLPNSKVLSWFSDEVCYKKIPSPLCTNMLFLMCGYDAQQMNASRIPVYTAQQPAGTSVQNLIHFVQMIKAKEFQKFDFGEVGNVKKYNQTTPPVYNLSNVKVPVAIYTGTADWLVVASDVVKLLADINSNIVENKVITGWEHLDFIWAMNGPQQCYDDLISVFKKMI